MNILNKLIVLVLNRNWQAINIRTPQDAFCQMATKVATALDIEEAVPERIEQRESGGQNSLSRAENWSKAKLRIAGELADYLRDYFPQPRANFRADVGIEV